MPFPRLIRAMDRWAGLMGRDDVVAQIGDSEERPGYLQAQRFLAPQSFRDTASCAEVIVAHAGMGTILTAMDYQKPIIVMPRLARLGEHRNDHQVDTAKRLAQAIAIEVAEDEQQLFRALEGIGALKPPRDTGADRTELCRFLSDFIHRRD